MSGGYPQHPPGYGYGAPPSQPYSAGAPPPHQPYGTAPPYGAAPYGAPSAPYSGAPSEKPKKDKHDMHGVPPSQPYSAGAPPPHQPYGAATPYGGPTGAPYGAATPYGGPTGAPYGAPSDPYSGAPSEKPKKDKYDMGGGGGGYPPAGGYASPFAALLPSTFPPGTDPNVVACFQMADEDGSGFIDDTELQRALSSYNQKFSLRTVRLLMFLFTNSNTRKIGPKEFTAVFYSLQNWRSIFERFDRDMSGKIDANELRDALFSLGFSVSPVVLDLLVTKFDKTGGKNRAIEYDNFIECCLTVKGLTEKFKEKVTAYSGNATFNYEVFMLTVLPFLIA